VLTTLTGAIAAICLAVLRAGDSFACFARQIAAHRVTVLIAALRVLIESANSIAAELAQGSITRAGLLHCCGSAYSFISTVFASASWRIALFSWFLNSVSAASFVYFAVAVVIYQVVTDFLCTRIYTGITVITVYLAGCLRLDDLRLDHICSRCWHRRLKAPKGKPDAD